MTRTTRPFSWITAAAVLATIAFCLILALLSFDASDVTLAQEASVPALQPDDIGPQATEGLSGTIAVGKVTEPSGSTQQFEFAASYSVSGFALSDGQSGPSGHLEAGTYWVTETVPAGWDLTEISCQGGVTSTWTTNVDTHSVEIALAQGETVTCTFTNAEQGHIVVDKVTDPSGSAQLFEFNPSWGSLFTLADADPPHDSGPLSPGTYSVTETLPAGWNLTEILCQGGVTSTWTTNVDTHSVEIALAQGETVTCTFTNAEQGHIVVDKVTDPSGAAQAFQFNPSWGSPFALADSDTPVDSGPLSPGMYSVRETVPPGWELTAVTCTAGTYDNIVLDAGETVTCTFTNTRQTGSIELQKVWEGTPGIAFLRIGTSAWGRDIAYQLVSGTDGTTGVQEVGTGTYYVSEAVLSGYDAELLCYDQDGTVSVGPNGSLYVGDDKVVTCVYTNRRQTGSIELRKAWEGTPGDTILRIGTSSGLGDIASQFVIGADGTTGAKEVDTGTYYVSETALSDYDTELLCYDEGGGEVSVGPYGRVYVGNDEVVTCVYTNTRQTGRIQVVKVLEPDSASGRFNLQIDGMTDPDAQGVGDGGSTGIETVETGEHTVGETPGTGTDPDDYDTAISCVERYAQGTMVASTTTVSLTVPVGDDQDIICTITNTAKADLAVLKFDEPSTVNVGDMLTYSVRVTNNGPAGAQDVVVMDTLPPGANYERFDGQADSCVEDPPGTLTCQLGNVEATDTVSFNIVVSISADAENTIRNRVSVTSTAHDPNPANNVDDEFTSVEFSPAIKVTKSGPVSANVGDTVAYTFTLTNEDDEGDGSPITDITLSDDTVDPVYVSGDQDGDEALDLTESWVFVAESQVKPTDTTPLVNTATASGLDVDRDVITGTDTHTMTIAFEPHITVEKTGPALASLGDTVLYTFTVRNNGISGDGSPIHSVAVTDTLAGEATLVRGDVDADDLLEVAETWIFTAAHALTSIGTVTNTATVSGQDGNGDPVTDTDNHSVSVYQAAIEVEKTGPRQSEVGDVVAYTVTITNASSPNAPILSLDSITDSMQGDLTNEANVVTSTCMGPLTTGHQCQIVYTYTVQHGNSTPLVNAVWVESQAVGVTNVVTASAEHPMGVTTLVHLPLFMSDYPPPWKQGTGLPAGVQVRTLAVCASNPNVVYAGFGVYGHGVYRSVNAGRTWAQTGLQDAAVFGIVIAPGSCNAVYAGAWEAGVMKSLNGGLSWDSSGGPNGAFTYSVVIDPVDSDVIYAGTALQGLYRSRNAGASWESWGLSGLTVPDLAFLAPPGETERVLYAATWEDGVYKRSHSGTTWGAWTSVSEGIASQHRKIYAVNPVREEDSTVFAATYAGGVYRRLNGGGAWAQVLPSPGRVYAVVVDPANSDIVYAGTHGDGVYRSTANGDQGTWHPLNIQLGNLVARSLAIGPPSAEYIHVGTAEGTWRRPR